MSYCVQGDPALSADLQQSADGQAVLQADGGQGRQEGGGLGRRIHPTLQGK